MRRSLLLILLWPGLSGVLHADDRAPWFVSPGLRMSYCFGDRQGFSLGFEVSVFTWVHWSPSSEYSGAVGIIFDVDASGPRRRVHIGIEASEMWVGVSAGPTFITEDGERYTGFTATAYSFYWAYPFYSYTWARGIGSIHDIGAYIKLPIPITRGPIFNQ